MARNNWNGKRSGVTPPRGRGTKVSHEKEVTHMAYLMGCVQRGLKNPDSQISSSYRAGQEYVQKQRKSLY